jgi:hypothetical protein
MARPAFIRANVPRIPGVSMPPDDFDEKGRIKFPAFLSRQPRLSCG